MPLRDATEYLNLSAWTVRTLANTGTLHRVQLPVRKLLFDREEPDRLIDGGRMPGTSAGD